MSATTYIGFNKAKQLLAERFGATPEEIAAWIFMSPEDGGIAAYTNANEGDDAPPPRFFFTLEEGADYLAPLMRCWFDSEALALFEPKDRFITGLALVHRWSGIGEHVRHFIRARIAESRLTDIHPVFGGTQWTESNDFPSDDTALFALTEIEAVEVEEGIDPNQPAKVVGETGLDPNQPAKVAGETEVDPNQPVKVVPQENELENSRDDAYKSDETSTSAQLAVSRNRIMGEFRVKYDDAENTIFWDAKLADPPRWLRGARTTSGRRGVSALWNPKLVAHALLERRKMSVNALDKTMRERFSSQWEDWQEETRDHPR